MATREQCPLFDQCGFVAWRRDRVSVQSEPLPANGDCGKQVDKCGRYKGNGPASLGDYGPETRDELEIAYPTKKNDHGRPEKRIFGSGSR